MANGIKYQQNGIMLGMSIPNNIFVHCSVCIYGINTLFINLSLHYLKDSI
jgi:hypothetical protein